MYELTPSTEIHSTLKPMDVNLDLQNCKTTGKREQLQYYQWAGTFLTLLAAGKQRLLQPAIIQKPIQTYRQRVKASSEHLGQTGRLAPSQLIKFACSGLQLQLSLICIPEMHIREIKFLSVCNKTSEAGRPA